MPIKTTLSEAKENLGPGTDTTSATPAHIIWTLGYNVQFQELLHRDAQNINISESISDLEAVPQLRASVKEGIRCAGAAAVTIACVITLFQNVWKTHSSASLPG
jgi:cytochrome P450